MALGMDGVATSAEEQFETFQDAVSQTFVPLAMSIADVSVFCGQLRSASVGEVQMSEVAVAANGVIVRRTNRLIRRNDPDYLKVGVQLSGSSTVHQDDRQSTLLPGDLAIYDTSRPYQLRFTKAYRLLVVMLPKPLLRLPRSLLADLTARVICGQAGLGAAVSPFLAHVGRRILTGDHPENRHLADAIVDLVAASLAESPPGQTLRSDADRRAQLVRVQAYIERSLGDPSLDVGTIAAANWMSVRYLQRLFEDAGETVTGWIRARRIEQCRRDLVDARYTRLPVSSVAARWGLVNAAHFSRLFKSVHGVAPTEYRALALQAAPRLDERKLGAEASSKEGLPSREWRW